MSYLKRRTLTVMLLAGLNLISRSSAPAAEPRGIKAEPYRGWEDSLIVNSDEAEARLVVVPNIGGRIMRYELMGDNVLWDNPITYGLTIAKTPKALQPGGYQLYINSETLTLANLDRMDFGPYKVTKTADYSVSLASEPDLVSGLVLEKDFILDPQSGEVGITQRAKNTGSQPMACSLRARTLCKTGGYLVIPLNKKSIFPQGWSQGAKSDSGFRFDPTNPQHPNVKILSGMLIAEIKGQGTWIGADSDPEWIAYIYNRSLFIQYFPIESGGKYPNGGNTVEAGWNENFAILDLLAPEKTMAPGQAQTFLGKWMMIELPKTINSQKDARSAANKVPPSPFKAKK